MYFKIINFLKQGNKTISKRELVLIENEIVSGNESLAMRMFKEKGISENDAQKLLDKFVVTGVPLRILIKEIEDVELSDK